jgi:hypothetical protein
MDNKSTPRAAPVPPELRSELAGLVARVGENEARRAVNLSRTSFTRVLAGLTVYPGTRALLQAGLGSVEARHE